MEKKEQEIDESKIAGSEKQLDIAIKTGDDFTGFSHVSSCRISRRHQ
jgi:hypothetical protein